jgi:hypothetical protein
MRTRGIGERNVTAAIWAVTEIVDVNGIVGSDQMERLLRVELSNFLSISRLIRADERIVRLHREDERFTAGV